MRGRVRLWSAVELVLISGLLAGVAFAVVRGWTLSRMDLPRLKLYLATVCIDGALLGSAWAVGVSLALFASLKRLAPGERFRSRVAVATGMSLPALYVAYRINQEYLPGIRETASVLGNSGLVVAFVVVALVLARGLQRWTTTSRRSSARWRAWRLSTLSAMVLALNAAFLLARAGDGPNVIVILVDALRADHLSCHGYERPTSPNIDRLARDAVVFTQAVSSSTFTKTSIASLFTGLHPHHHVVFRGSAGDTPGRIRSDVLGEKHVTLAEALREHGMATVAWVENAQLRHFMGFDQGFAIYRDQAGSASSINKKFLSWLRKFGGIAPVFAYLHYIDLHDPYRPPSPFDTMYGSYSDVYAGLDLGEYRSWGKVIREIREGKRNLQPEDIEQLEAYYDGMLTYLDRRIGELLEGLRDQDAYEDSLIVLTADHGDGFMEHGFISHSTTPYEELIRVPLIVKLPRSAHAGRRIDRQVRSVDVAPTILSIVDAGALKNVDGVSLQPVIAGDHAHAGLPPPRAFSEVTGSMAIRTEKWKFIDFLDGRYELYDLRADPGEQVNVAAENPRQLEKFRQIGLKALSARYARSPGTVPVDSETLKDLKALGYVE